MQIYTLPKKIYRLQISTWKDAQDHILLWNFQVINNDIPLNIYWYVWILKNLKIRISDKDVE